MRRLACAGLAVYAVAIVLLGVRPYVEPLYGLAYQSDIGAYNMFRAEVRAEQRAWLDGPGGERIAVPLDRYFWKNTPVSTTHSNVSEAAVERFVAHLAGRPEVLEHVPSGERASWRLVYELRVEKNREPPQTLRRSRRLEGAP